MKTLIVVKATYDDEAGVWFTESTDLAGLRIEAGSVENLVKKLPAAILDLLEDGDGGFDGVEVPIELIAHASTRVRFAA